MFSTFDDIVFSIILVSPIAFFYTLAKKHWLDNNLSKAFWNGIIFGVLAVFFVKLIYIPIGIYLGGQIHDFLYSTREWYIILIASIGIVGFVEEGFKALGAHIVCCFNRTDGFRPTFVFMSFAGCALSFSFLENLQYYYIYGASIVLPRIIVNSVAHLAFASICGYYSSIAFNLPKSPGKTAIFLNLGLLISSILHGIFDFLITRCNGFSIISLSGLIISLISVLIFIIYEIWIEALKHDLPPEGTLLICSSCRALTVERIRFCPFCGNRIKKVDSFPTIIRETKPN